jgi:hypothetical protein
MTDPNVAHEPSYCRPICIAICVLGLCGYAVVLPFVLCWKFLTIYRVEEE